MGEEDRGGLPDPDLSKNRGGLPDLDLDPTRPDFCRGWCRVWEGKAKNYIMPSGSLEIQQQ